MKLPFKIIYGLFPFLWACLFVQAIILAHYHIAGENEATKGRVIVLSEGDAHVVRDAWEKKQEAERVWQQVRSDIEERYLLTGFQPEGWSYSYNYEKECWYIDGFGPGWSFSSDWKYVIP